VGIEPATGHVVASATLPGGAVRLAAGAGRLWVTGLTNTLADVDPSPTGSALHWSTITVGSGPLGVAAGDGAVWVADATTGTVTRVDPATGRVTGTYRAGPDPVSVAVAGGRTWVVDGKTDDLRTIGSGRQPKPVALGGTPRQLVAVDGAIWTAVGNPGEVAAAAG
jgi:streptogramin lyase